MDMPVSDAFKKYFKLDDLFRRGDLLLDKESDTVFFYNPDRHREWIFKNPNNYRVAHKGDMGNVVISRWHRIAMYYYRLKYKVVDYFRKG